MTLLTCAPKEDSNRTEFRVVWSVFIVRMEKHWIFGKYKMRSVKIRIRLRECAGWSESSLGAHVRRYVFCRFGPNTFLSLHLMQRIWNFFIFKCSVCKSDTYFYFQQFTLNMFSHGIMSMNLNDVWVMIRWGARHFMPFTRNMSVDILIINGLPTVNTSFSVSAPCEKKSLRHSADSESLGPRITRFHIYRMFSDKHAWANSVDHDETPHNAASHQGLHCLSLIQHFLDPTTSSKLYLFKF